MPKPITTIVFTITRTVLITMLTLRIIMRTVRTTIRTHSLITIVLMGFMTLVVIVSAIKLVQMKV